MSKWHLYHKTMGGSLLIAGTCIGGGMLSLPKATASSGLLPTSVMLGINCIIMITTGLFFARLCLQHSPGVNLISLSRTILGPWAVALTWFAYLLLFYSLVTAYLCGIGKSVSGMSGDRLPPFVGSIFIALLLLPSFLKGTRAIDLFNRILMAGLILSFVLILFQGVFYLHLNYITEVNWSAVAPALPFIFTSFGFQGTVPTLVTYLDRDWNKIKKAIVLGCLLPLFIYCIWESIALGSLPASLLVQQEDALEPLMKFWQAPFIALLAPYFIFFILTTSLVGVCLGLFDFFADAWKIKKGKKGRLLLSSIIFFPTTVVAVTNPALFFAALKYGANPAAIWILGVLPTCMIWKTSRPPLLFAKKGFCALLFFCYFLLLLTLLY